MARTDHCGNLTEASVGKKVTVSGWVQKRRDLGGLIFIDLRDRSGIVQVVANPDISNEALMTAEKVRSEFLLEVTGEVILRDEAVINTNLPTGKIEIQADAIEIINTSKTPPFQIKEDIDVSEEFRLKYRYLDLRRPKMQRIFKMRHQVTRYIRQFLDNQEFLDIETPILTKSTPEGARDYLVPSRVHPGEFYALPQSPQLFKQLLMVSGFERYYQIVRCFRDEDLRADRQPEFTQIDIEVSFFEQEDFLKMIEEMMVSVVNNVKGMTLSQPFPVLTYREAMARYGSDKPDTRFGMELINLSEEVKESGFKVFSSTVEGGGEVKALNVKNLASAYSRKNIDALTDFVKGYGAKGLAWLKVEEDGLKGPIAKFFDEEITSSIINKTEAEPGDLLLFVADKKKVVADSLGALRVKLGKEHGLIDESKYNFLWITEFPLFGYDEEEGRYVAEHHPFTMPMLEDIDNMETNPGDVRAQAYDLVLNGYELGSGSQRIYKRDIQELMFRTLGFSDEEARERFGFLLDAFEYGTPPHRGIALGLDRIIMILAGANNLRETIAFPKTASASCLMTNAPSEVSEGQLEDLHIHINNQLEIK